MEENHQEALNIIKDLRHTICGASASLAKSLADIPALEERLGALAIEIAEEELLQNHVAAFKSAREYVDAILNDGEETLAIKVLAVSSSFSWHFIGTYLKSRLEGRPNLIVYLEWLLVDPDCLKNAAAGLNSLKVPWEQISREKESEIKKVLAELPSDISSRFVISLKYFTNIPHWHGMLINDMQLYLGRTSWEPIGDELHLRVGENEYRIFSDVSVSRGAPRVRLFKNWFNYYQRSGRVVL